jgi:hypothetical protein
MSTQRLGHLPKLLRGEKIDFLMESRRWLATLCCLASQNSVDNMRTSGVPICGVHRMENHDQELAARVEFDKAAFTNYPDRNPTDKHCVAT